MEIMNKNQIISYVISTKGMPAVYVSNNLEYSEYSTEDDEIWNCLKDRLNNNTEILSTIGTTQFGLFFFDLDKEANDFFNKFNEDPVYASGIYATLYDSNGNIIDENT